jgi:ABC-2 type transport system ATP-binding protein
VRNQRIQDLLGRVGLDGRGRDRLGTFSKGMMQRVGLAQALISRPRLVVLDEPTSGLDPLGRRYVRDVIRMLRDESVTVFLNSHQLGEVEAVCDRVAILNLGRLIGLGSIDELTGGELLVEVHAAGITPEILAGIERLARLEKVEADRLYLGVEQEALLPQIAACLHDGGARLYRLAPRRPSLEDLFVRLLEAE